MEYPRNYPLEIYIGHLSNSPKVYCSLQTPVMSHPPTYNTSAVIYDASQGPAMANRIQFAVSPALRMCGTGKMYSSVVVRCNSRVNVIAVNKETFSTDAFSVFEVTTLGEYRLLLLRCLPNH